MIAFRAPTLLVGCQFLPTRHSKHGTCYGNVAGWLAGWLDVTRPIILISSDPCADTQFQGEPFSGGVKYTGVGKVGDFRRKSPFMSEMVQDRPMTTMEH